MPISLEEAQQLILNNIPPVNIEQESLLEAMGRAAAEDIISDHALPPFDNSAMDGFAFRHEDIQGKNSLPVSENIPAGKTPAAPLRPGTACKIMTGAPVPLGADTVVPIENCAVHDNSVTILKGVDPGANIRRAGEDVNPGTCVVEAGTLIRSAEVNLLAAIRIGHIPVRRRAKVAILATGDELQEIDEIYSTGSIVNSNSWALAAALREIGAIPVMLGIARDDKNSLREKIRKGLRSDALITSAGVSAGDRDFVREVLNECGVQELFWKVDIRPGKPAAFGVAGNIPVFSLPGNPVATMLLFELLARPALLTMMGHRDVFRTTFKARLAEPIKKKTGSRQVMRLTVNTDATGELTVASAGSQNTGALSSLSAAQGFTVLPKDKDYFAAGEMIDLQLFGASTRLGY